MKVKYHRAYFANSAVIDVIGENRFKRTVKKLCLFENTHVIRFEKVYEDPEKYMEALT